MFVLGFVFNRMSSYQMESLKVMEKFDGGNPKPKHEAYNLCNLLVS
jgi:hypothetical protein